MPHTCFGCAVARLAREKGLRLLFDMPMAMCSHLLLPEAFQAPAASPFSAAMGQCGSREVRARAPIPEKRDEYVLYEGPGPWTVCLPDAEVPPRFAPTGIASEKLSPPSTLMQLLTTAAKRHSDRPALCVERPVPAVVDGTAWAFSPWRVGRHSVGGPLGFGRAQQTPS